MVKSLFQQALDFVGDNQKIFKLDSITALPCHVQEKFLPYLSAHDLYILSEHHPHSLNALILDQIWNLHVQRRWSRAQIVMNIFHETGLNENAKLVFLQKYFLEILSYCSINLNTVELDQYYEDLEIGMDNTYKPDTSNETDTSYEIDLFDEAVTPIPSKDPSISREFYCPDGSYICLKGVKTFAMLNTNSHCKEDFGNVLIEVLPHWTSLTKFAIFDTDAESEEMVNHIVKKLEDHQLTHLVIDDANLHQTFFERLLNTFRTHYRISNTKNMSHRPLELLDFQACLKSLSAGDLVPFEGPICGIQRLDLSMTTILDSGFSLLLEHLKNDTALKHLKLNGCFLREDQVLKLLSILSEKCQLETLGLSGNKVREDEVESELIKFMANNKRLQTLILNYSRLRCQFVDSDIFMETILTHPSLRELSVKNNHLKETVCRLLKRVCCAKNPCSLRSLNIGYNWVKGAELVETAQEIIAFRKSHQMFGSVLDFLCLSGNRLHLSDSSQSRLWNVFDGLVKDLEVDRIDYNRPFDEHLAQM